MAAATEERDDKEVDRKTSSYKSSFIKENQTEKMIRVKDLSAYLFAFLIGIFLVLLFQDIFSKDLSTFSSLELITFTFSIALSGASIFLALAAIDLGKKSEQLMMIQNEESIHLQNEIFTKTNETLLKIGTSTGITEKRIDDMISGKVISISKTVANEIDDGTKNTTKTEIEDSVRKSILEALRPISPNSMQTSAPPEVNEITKKEQLRDKLYESFNQSIMFGIANLGKFKIEKIKEGLITSPGDEAVDGIFTIENKRFAVCTFLGGPEYRMNFKLVNIKKFYETIVQEIANGHFSKIFLVFSQKVDENNNFVIGYNSAKEIVRPEILENIILIDGTASEVISLINNKMG